MIPCPRHARHLVASPTTAWELFLGLEEGLASSAESQESTLQRAEFDLARHGYDGLFQLNSEDADYVDNRVRELIAKRVPPKTKGSQSGVAIGNHIRRGDRHPLEFMYRDSYIPISKYSDTARNIIDERVGKDTAAKHHSFLIIASDDPTVYENDDFADAPPAQDRIKLASKQATQSDAPDRRVMHKFVDENFGWEGGFFASMFWNLGIASTSAAAPTNTAPRAETIRLRSLVGRAYLMDLAVLADASDAVVCTASAAGCRLLAVMMGWESAMERGNWVNIDRGSTWTGLLR